VRLLLAVLVVALVILLVAAPSFAGSAPPLDTTTPVLEPTYLNFGEGPALGASTATSDPTSESYDPTL
jgi:hypothetical protein